MIPQTTSAGARFGLVTNCLLQQPAATHSRLRLIRIGRRPLATHHGRTSTIPTALIIRSSRLLRRIHSNGANMSANHPTDSLSESSSPIVSSSTPKELTAASKEEEEQQTGEKKLAPLKGAEFRAYNRLAEHMDVFHEHFRTGWNALWAAANSGGSSNKSKGSSRGGRGVISDGLAFVAQLEMHHSIEETYIFPILARRMSEFRSDGKGGKGTKAAELIRQHAEIHEGMEGMQNYLRSCRDGERELDMATLKTQMESWGTVLWKHLDQEVETLGAENMRKYWTVEEIRRIPM